MIFKFVYYRVLILITDFIQYSKKKYYFLYQSFPPHQRIKDKRFAFKKKTSTKNSSTNYFFLYKILHVTTGQLNVSTTATSTATTK
jgi:hypothetical protein